MSLNTAIENRQIRIFISSTFRDMQEERDHLVTKIFPALRRYCEERDVSLFELDLRWGISEDESKQGKVVDICLKEIQKTTPFFIGILGERYGWVPNEDERRKIAESTQVFKEYPWIQDELLKGTSITEIEIQEGVLRSKEKVNAYFYFRSPGMEVEEGFKENPGSREAQKLAALKQTLRKQQDYPVKDYDSIEHLGNLVEADFKALVDMLFPHGALSPLEKERLLQRVYLKRMTRVYVPNPEYDARIDRFVKAYGGVLVICGEAGIGKSALLAHWIQNRGERKNEKIIYHFIGQGGDEGDFRKITHRFIEEIRDLYGLQSVPPPEQSKGKDPQKEELQNLLAAVKDRGRLVIIMDGLDKLQETDKDKIDKKDAHKLEWFPNFSDNVRFICTTNKIQGGRNGEYIIPDGCNDTEVGTLDVERRKMLIAEYLVSFGKKLTSSQIECIANDKENENSLALITLLDELRMFGKYEELDGEIDRYLAAGTIPDLFTLVLERLEKNYNYGKGNFVGDALSLLYVSQKGLSEAEICNLTGTEPLYWSQLYNGIASHLIARGGLVTFAHSFIRDAVNERYLSGSMAIREYGMKIVNFMNDPLSMVPLNRKIDELIYQTRNVGSQDVLRTPEICLAAVQQRSYALEYVPEKLRTQAIYLAVVQHDGRTLKYVPEALRTPEICLAAVQQDGMALEYVPKTLRTPEICLAAVQKRGWMLMYVPDELLTPEICLVAMQQDGALWKVPEVLRTPEICLAAVQQYGKALEDVPESLRTPEIYLAAVQQDGWLLRKIPKELRTPEICLAAVQQKGSRLDYVPESLRTPEICLVAVQRFGLALQYVPEALRTLEICLAAVQQDGRALEYVPEALLSTHFINMPSVCLEMIKKKNSNIKFVPETMLTEEFCIDAIEVDSSNEVIQYLPVALRTEKVCHAVIEANWIRWLKQPLPKIDSLERCLDLVERDGEAIMFVPGKYLTDEMCRVAVRQHGNALKYVPETLRTPEICLIAVQHFGSWVLEYLPDGFRIPEICLVMEEHSFGVALKYVPEALRTPEICLVAVQSFGLALKDVPKVLMTSEICFAAVQQNGRALVFVPETLRTPEICLAAVQQDGRALVFVPETLRLPEICLKAVQQDGLAFKDVPEVLMTSEICFAAVQQNGRALHDVPEVLRTPEICLAAVQQYGKALVYVPETLQTPEICLAAVQQDGLALEYVPEVLMTQKICLAAVQQDGLALKYVPKTLQTQEICLTAVQQDGLALEYVPEALLWTPEICLVAVQQNGLALDHVPEVLRTPEICLAAVQQNREAICYVPEALKAQVKKAGGIE